MVNSLMASASNISSTNDHDRVILVNQKDEEQGLMDKMEAHQKGLLHRAFSVFVFNDKGEVLLHQRAMSKYHSPGLWTNACCSHPRPGEQVESAAHRRLREEMGFDCRLKYAFPFIYKSELDNALIEHELDHVFTGDYSGIPNPNPTEVKAWKFMNVEKLLEKMKETPADFTAWFKIVFERVLEYRD